MEMTSVISSNIAAAGYDSDSGEMHVQFNSGHVYAYYGVPEELYQAFENSPSKGQFFHQFIRGRYNDTRLG